MKPSQYPVYDYDRASDIFVDDVVQVDPLGPVTRLAFAATETCVTTGKKQRLVVVKLIIPNSLRQHLGRLLLSNVPLQSVEQDWATDEITAH